MQVEFFALPDPDVIRRAAELYVESSEANHGEVELARWEAELWWGLLVQATAEMDGG